MRDTICARARAGARRAARPRPPPAVACVVVVPRRAATRRRGATRPGGARGTEMRGPSFAGLALLLYQGPASALDNGVGLTPAMGYNTWDDFRCGGINASNLYLVADAMLAQGLPKLGYIYVSLDVSGGPIFRKSFASTACAVHRMPAYYIYITAHYYYIYITYYIYIKYRMPARARACLRLLGYV